MSEGVTRKDICFLVLVTASVSWFWTPILEIVSRALQYGRYETYSHIVLIPLISMYLLYLDRSRILAKAAWAPRVGGILILAALTTHEILGLHAGEELSLSLAMLMMVVTSLGVFLLCYGCSAFRHASFALILLFLMVPVPPVVLEGVIASLQRGSAETSEVFFGLLGVPVFREGFLFALPGITIEVAEECSGIRSSMALLVTSLVAGHLFLRSPWAKAMLVIWVVPLTIVKNAVRIVSLSLLASYIDPAFVTDSALHRNSGIPVFGVALAVLAGTIWLLQKSERQLGWRGDVRGLG